MGASSRPWRQSLSDSMLSERFNPRIPANEKATHSIPGLRPSAPEVSNEKLKMTSTRRPNHNMELIASLFRNSMAMSLWMIATIGFIAPLPEEYALHTLREPQN